jgi:hypothetical protein
MFFKFLKTYETQSNLDVVEIALEKPCKSLLENCQFCLLFDLLINDVSPSRSQFHQHFTHGFFVQKSYTQLFCTYSLDLYVFGARMPAQMHS